MAVGTADGKVTVWNTTTWLQVKQLTDASGAITSVAFSVDGSLVAAASTDTNVRVWDTATWSLQHTFSGHSVAVYAIDFAFNGSYLASGAGDSLVKIWDLGSGRKSLYDLADDRSETKDVAEVYPEELRRLDEAIAEQLRSGATQFREIHGSAPPAGLDAAELPAEVLETLEALGYVAD